jgi:putative salt-induced outer membrane protein
VETNMPRPVTYGGALLSGVLAAVLLTPSAALAQATELTGVEALDDRIDDITEDVQDELAESDDPNRFNTARVPQGWRGSAVLQFGASDGNTDTADLTGAARLTYGVGLWAHSFGVAARYGEDDGEQNEEEFFATYEGLRNLNDRFYAFGTGRFEYDDFSSTERDAFLGAGLGYRILTEPDLAWRVQAGPGVRYVKEEDGDSETEAAGIVSSRFYYGLTDQVALTNDTDVLTSDINTQVVNDFGVTLGLSENFAMRASYRTDYESDPLPGFESTDNTFGVALVVGF